MKVMAVEVGTDYKAEEQDQVYARSPSEAMVRLRVLVMDVAGFRAKGKDRTARSRRQEASDSG